MNRREMLLQTTEAGRGDYDERLRDFRQSLRPVLAKDLGRTQLDYLWNLSETGWEEMEPPDVDPSFGAFVGQPALSATIERFDGYFDNPEAARKLVLGDMLQYSGVRPLDESARKWIRLEREYPPSVSFPFATQALFGRKRPVGVRAVPKTFQENDQLRTPFYLMSNGARDGVLFLYDDGASPFIVGGATEMRPLQSAREIVYSREIKQEGLPSRHRIIVNPLISCRERCSFCVRQYDNVGRLDLGAEEPFLRNRLSPEEMAGYTFLKYHDLRGADIESIGIVTGAFDNFDHLYTYVDRFAQAVARETAGHFDPRVNQGQQFFALTHVVTERSQMEAIRELGVKNVSHTLEVIDDQRRSRVMPAKHIGPSIISKASVSFDQTLASIPSGVEVFGPDNYRVVAIIGMDDFDTTVRGAAMLREAGLTRLDSSILRAHNVGTLGSYAMSFLDLMEAKRRIIDIFRKTN